MGPRAPPDAEAEASFTHAGLSRRSTSGISPSFLGLFRSSGQVAHVLLTRSRLSPRPKPGSSLHLHVLGTPPAFVLSQDQTLRKKSTEGFNPITVSRASGSSVSEGLPCSDGAAYTRRRQHDGSCLCPPSARARRRVGTERGSRAEARDRVALLSFQRPRRSRRGASSSRHEPPQGRPRSISR